MGVPIYIIDAFTNERYRGNPAGVCLPEDAVSEAWMQQIASELNLSETAFVRPLDDGYELRWFTPRAEVDLCGHATLAAAHLLWETGRLGTDQAAMFRTGSGRLTVRRKPEGWMEMDFPALPPAAIPASRSLLDALNAERLLYAGGNGMDLVVEIESEAKLSALAPDYDRIARLPARGVIVTCQSEDPAFDFKSRAFFPALGVREDPVTGSAHCALAPYWAAKLGKRRLTAYQASARGGSLRLQVMGERVLLEGQAVTVLRGQLAAREAAANC